MALHLSGLFNGRPIQVVSRFSQYHKHVEQLPSTEQTKIDGVAELVVNSFFTDHPVVAIGLRGHADQDLPKSGTTRTQFEQRISEERASEVGSSLSKAIRNKASRRL